MPRLGLVAGGVGAVIACLFVWFHFDFLWRSLLFGLNNKNWSHALLVPFISLYFIFLKRDRLSFAPIERIGGRARLVWCVLGGATALAGGAAYFVPRVIPLGVMGQVAELGGMILVAIGAVALLAAAVFSSPLVRGLWAPMMGRLGLGTRPEFWLRVLGLGVMLAGLIVYVLTLYPISNHMARGYSMIIGLFGLVLFLAGPRSMQVFWLPILYLGFAVKISDRVWQEVAQRLQDVAAAGSTVALKCFAAVMSFDVQSAGNQITLFIPSGVTGMLQEYPINIAEACSGLRMLMAFIALGTALAFAWDRKWWQRVIIIASTVPIAVLVNIGRVTVIGLLYLVDPELAKGETHTFVGMLMLIPAALLLLGIGWVLEKIIIEEPRSAQATPAAPSPGSDQATASMSEGGLASFARASRDAGLGRLLAAAGWGLFLGAILMALAGAAYVLVLGASRPDVIGHALSSTVASMLLTGVLVVLALGTIAVPWFMLRRSAASPGSRLMAAGVVMSMLLVATVGQQTVLGMTKAVMFKQELPLRRPLVMIPLDIGQWHSPGQDTRLPAAQEETLGTEKYLIRRYEDRNWPSDEPGRVARLHVAYYPGSINQVPHVPDRCYVAGGMQPQGTTTVSLPLTGDHYKTDGDGLTAHSKLLSRSDAFTNPARIPSAEIPATLFSFEANQTGRGGEAGNVIYFFTANGKFLPTPLMVRKEGWDLSHKYAYYCKIEVAWPGVSDAELAKKRTRALLSDLMPEIMACLPDWQAVQAGQYQPDQNDQAQRVAAKP